MPVIHGNCLEVMARMEAKSVDLIFADPPFNVDYHYDEYKDDLTPAEYVEWTHEWIAAAARVLSPAGSIFVAIGDEFAADVKKALDRYGLTQRNWIIWHYGFGVQTFKKFARCHTHILYHVANPKQFTFNADDVKVPSARQTKYNDKRAAGGGKVPEDVWDIPRLCGTFKERTDHPCQMPEALLERVIKVASNPGDLVLDPFAGSALRWPWRKSSAASTSG